MRLLSFSEFNSARTTSRPASPTNASRSPASSSFFIVIFFYCKFFTQSPFCPPNVTVARSPDEPSAASAGTNHGRQGLCPRSRPRGAYRDPANQNGGSPYPATTLELCTSFGTTPERRVILKGFLKMRAALRQLEIVNGFQWVDGHFLEDDRHKKKAPDHIQVVTFCRPSPHLEDPQYADLAGTIRNRKKTREQYRVDHMPVLLTLPPEKMIDYTRFWCNLLSHQRRGRGNHRHRMDLHLTHTHTLAKLKRLTVSTRSGDKKPSYELIGLKDSGRLPAKDAQPPTK